MFWTGDSKLLLVSCADVIEHMPNFNLQFSSALTEASWKWPFKLLASLWCAPIKKKIKQQRLGTTNQMKTNLFTSPLIKALPVHMFVLRLTFYQNKQIKNPNYVIFLPFILFLASLSRINILVTVSRQLLILLGQCTTAPLFSLQQLAY